MGGWGLRNPNLVRILKTVRNIGRSLTKLILYYHFVRTSTEICGLLDRDGISVYTAEYSIQRGPLDLEAGGSE